MTKSSYVTQPSLAPIPEFAALLQEAWDSGVLTHNGPLMLRLERELCAYLKVVDLVAVANGTCAMQLAIRALDLSGEVITTPFTFIATANIIAWERCTPVFVDIDAQTWNLDASKIEAAITPRTSALLPVHVFSAPCDIERIQEIARRRGLKVIYDAAHAMAVDRAGESLLNHGDVSCVSFHATKLFNTAEGGACVSADPELCARIRRLRFFGFDDNKEISDEGMNAKMTEVHAALGLANLKHLDKVRANRRQKYRLYMELLRRAPFVTFQRFSDGEYNYSYMPVLFDREERLLAVLKALAEKRIYPRRYFHPALHTIAKFQGSGSLPVAERVASGIVCLPLYDTLSEEQISEICSIVVTAGASA
jgi:dTDP-4-amino-4,6-dideoxygalactose transaminase